MKHAIVVAILAVLMSSACAQQPPLALPSSLPLADYETKVLYPWLFERRYAQVPGVRVDSRVRDTGPYVQGMNYGVHPAVRIYYSADMVRWLNAGRPTAVDKLPQNGSFVVKEMFAPPAAIYAEIRRTPYFEANPDRYEALLGDLIVYGWTVMVKDTGGESKDGWFWAGPGPQGSQGNVDDFSHVLTSGFGVGTCIRCHASATSENTFASTANFAAGEQPLQFRVDNSWRSDTYLDAVIGKLKAFPGIPPAELDSLLARLTLPAQQQPRIKTDLAGSRGPMNRHAPASDTLAEQTGARATRKANPQFLASFATLDNLRVDPTQAEIARLAFPPEYADHVYPGPDPQHYITSSNCYGCHGGLGGAPAGVSGFIQTGPGYGEGYNISPYGEWRWSPMGLAGRDPIFHAQLESELIIMLQENGQLQDGRPGRDRPGDLYPVRTVQQALVDTCLRCHGAMGLRQKGLDQDGSILNPHFDTDLFNIRAPLTVAETKQPPYVPPSHQPGPHPDTLDYDAYRYGDLAREGVSCAICHHIAPPDPATAAVWAGQHPDWLGQPEDRVWNDSFFYFLGVNNTGIYTRSEADQLFGPFADIVPAPMQHAMGIKPVQATVMAGRSLPFTRESEMCGTCHSINLPNIGAAKGQREYPILTALEPNPVIAGLDLPHSIEQATYLEWLNSRFGLGKDNKRGAGFRSCQDCHMPNRFAALDDDAVAQPIAPLTTQIATIQDATYPQTEEQLPADKIDVKTRPDYRRHELVGLNAFLVQMFKQFPEILGVNDTDYETGASNGADLAIQNMLLSAREGRVATVAIDAADVGNEQLAIDVSVANRTGHRLPSGVSFRRVWVEMLIFDVDGDVIWGSGRTNAAGLLVDGEGKPLPTELLNGGTVSVEGRSYDHQPHYQTVRRQDQVQIYEELVKNAAGKFTTSFVHRIDHVKDNRLLPEGWVTAAEFAGRSANAGIGDQGALLYELMTATEPEGVEVKADLDFARSPSSGADRFRYEIPLADLRGGKPARIQATVYSQAFMPAWFYQRFALANDARAEGYATPATDRLFYLASRLDLQGTPMQDWKLEVTSTGRLPLD